MTQKILPELFSLQDPFYKDFQSKLMPTVSKDKIIGVRTPELRHLFKSMTKEEREEFISVLPHRYYEEDNLHALFIKNIRDYDSCIKELDRFLPFVDNWATCDMMRPEVLKRNPDSLMIKINQWLKSEHTYTVRFAIKCLMDFYLDEGFSPEILKTVSLIDHSDYYVKMMCAWFFATALASQYESTVPYLEEKRLQKWIHNKTIQKAIESYRISDSKKAYLKTLKIHGNS